MSREEEHAVVVRLRDGDARLGRGRQHLDVRARAHRLFVHAGVAGVRDEEGVVHALQEHIVLLHGVGGEHPEELLVKELLAYAPEVIHRRLRPPADVDGAGDVLAREVHDLDKFVPIFDIFEGDGLHGRAGDDHAVELHLFHFRNGTVKLLHVRLGDVRALIARRPDEVDVHLQRSVAEQPHELGLRHLFCGHEVDDGDFQRADVLRARALRVHDEDLLAAQRRIGGYVFRNDDGHIASVVTLSSPSYAGRRPLPSPAARESAQACAASSACLTSAMRSSAFSMPQERRTRSGDTPQAASSASVI